MKQQQKLLAGVYLDTQKAIIIRPAPDYEKGDYIIQDTFEADIHSRTGDQDSKNRARQTDLLKYFKSVASLLLVYDELYIFGPANIQEQFQNHLKADAQFNNKQITIDSSEQMPDHKMISKVRDFFEMKNHPA